MKYLIERRVAANNPFPVCSAQGDASAILREEGFKPLYVGHAAQLNKLAKGALTIADCLRVRRVFSSEDSVFLQWPVNSLAARLLKNTITPPLVAELQLLVHDIDAIRDAHEQCDLERHFFTNATRLIVHSEQMKEYVVTHGVDSERVRILDCFDYLTTDPIVGPRYNSKTVVAVATTERSPFLACISAANLGFHVNLYGKHCKGYESILGKDITHKGTFRSDNVSALEGSWGLVWDGDSVDICSSSMGEYLRYNSPHKISLFVAAHIPIIIWDQAAKAEYVSEKGLGICVSSLHEVADRIGAITDEEYAQMVCNLQRESQKVRTGQQLRKCLA